jgi:hypothetical protein
LSIYSIDDFFSEKVIHRQFKPAKYSSGNPMQFQVIEIPVAHLNI